MRFFARKGVQIPTFCSRGRGLARCPSSLEIPGLKVKDGELELARLSADLVPSAVCRNSTGNWPPGHHPETQASALVLCAPSS